VLLEFTVCLYLSIALVPFNVEINLSLCLIKHHTMKMYVA